MSGAFRCRECLGLILSTVFSGKVSFPFHRLVLIFGGGQTNQT